MRLKLVHIRVRQGGRDGTTSTGLRVMEYHNITIIIISNFSCASLYSHNMLYITYIYTIYVCKNVLLALTLERNTTYYI